MLDTSEQRIKMLKKGISYKQIEKLYIERNSLKIVNLPVLIEMTEFTERQINKNRVGNYEITVEYTQNVYGETANLCDISLLSQFSELLYNNLISTKTDLSVFP
ncbi:Uncharacterised protein [uncultured archaeon]|nr:Uncharacterised protein [uncultured archaeon]